MNTEEEFKKITVGDVIDTIVLVCILVLVLYATIEWGLACYDGK